MAAVDELLIPLRPPGGIRRGSILQTINYRGADIMGVTIGIVQINVTDLERAKAALSEIEQRLTQNKRKQQIVATVAKRHRDPGVDELFELITR